MNGSIDTKAHLSKSKKYFRQQSVYCIAIRNATIPYKNRLPSPKTNSPVHLYHQMNPHPQEYQYPSLYHQGSVSKAFLPS